MKATLEQMLHTWASGGWVMGAMALLAIVMYGTAAHLLLKLYHRGLTKVTEEKLRHWVNSPTESPANVRELVRYTQDEVHSLRDIEGRFREIETAKISDVDRKIAF